MTGKVSFVGAGPGAVDLLTLRAARALEQCDVVLYDALVGPDVLQLAAHARQIAVGKRAQGTSTAQQFINKSLVDCARKYQRVVRLKGGDPSLFGRLDEEIAALETAGVAFDVVPGISAAFAAAAEIGSSLTRRGIARSLTLMTPRVAIGMKDGDAIAKASRVLATGSTLVMYMAGCQLQEIAEHLLADGIDSSTPVVIAENVSLPTSRRWSGSLAQVRFAPDSDGGPTLVMMGKALRTAGARETERTEQHDLRTLAA